MSFWLAGKLRMFDGSGHPWKLPVALTPLGCAAWIGITRLQACPHPLVHAAQPCRCGVNGWAFAACV